MNGWQTRRPGIGAFTLVEALVALCLFAIGMAALLPLAVSNLRANTNASVRTQALALAQEEIERFRSTTFADLPSLGTIGPPTLLDSVYTRQWQVVGVPTPLTGDDADLRRIRVVVRWDLPTGTGTVTLVTAKTRY